MENVILVSLLSTFKLLHISVLDCKHVYLFDGNSIKELSVVYKLGVLGHVAHWDIFCPL